MANPDDAATLLLEGQVAGLSWTARAMTRKLTAVPRYRVRFENIEARGNTGRKVTRPHYL
jgi:hypothetical protein